MRTDLNSYSIDVILHNQAPSGAYVASPTFPTYQYSWFRDGAYIAYAMDLYGYPESSARFHAWAAGVISRRAALITRAVENGRNGSHPGPKEILHTRFTLTGDEVPEEGWQNNQLDGFGTWLWALEQHCLLADRVLPAGWRAAAGLVAAYLEALWSSPCSDCWEEHPDQLHGYTLAAIYGGLAACSRLDGVDRSQTLSTIRETLFSRIVVDGHFAKSAGSDLVDANLLGLAVPYRVVAHDDPLMQATVRKIEADLVSGGVHRYAKDTYYGGGEWVLLAGWLGWYYALAGDHTRAQELAAWIDAQAGETGDLPEQVPQHLNDPSFYQPWVDRWGPIARPLLWSHANYLILQHFLK
jgi:GH15 family glucan-1,4-alpha-glucosidase